MALRLVNLRDPGEVARLEHYVADHPEGTAFHRPAWLLATARGTGNRALALVAESGGNLSGYLPLTEAQRLSQTGSFTSDLQGDEQTWSDELYRIYGLEPRSREITLEPTSSR